MTARDDDRPANNDTDTESPPRIGAVPVAGRPAHSARPLPRPSRIAAGVGTVAALAAIGVGTAALFADPPPAEHGGATLQPITVAAPPPAPLPLSGADILALLDRNPDFGALHDPQRRASCLT